MNKPLVPILTNAYIFVKLKAIIKEHLWQTTIYPKLLEELER